MGCVHITNSKRRKHPKEPHPYLRSDAISWHGFSRMPIRLGSSQDEAALGICLNGEREPVVRVEACYTAAEQGHASALFNLGVFPVSRSPPRSRRRSFKRARIGIIPAALLPRP